MSQPVNEAVVQTMAQGNAESHAAHKSAHATRKLLRVLLYITVIAVCVLTLYPYFVMLTSALKSRAEIFAVKGTILPVDVLWQNLLDIWTLAPMARYMLNSVLIAGGSTLIAMICGIPAAYALARMKFRGQTAFLGFVIVSQMFAPVVLLIGIYKVMSMLSLTDSIIGLIFINAAFNQAFTIWMLRGTFMGISAEMEQAATIDGCNRIQAMFRVLLPVAAPGIVTTLIFIFINAWNEYTVALTLISNNLSKPLTVGINIFNGYNMIQWQYLFAASLFAVVPVVILFMCIEKNLVAGLASGGVKG
jgi:multiple sugar transport system permease protein